MFVMVFFYVIIGLVFLLMNVGDILVVVGLIVDSVFNGYVVVGGFVGVIIMVVICFGVVCGVFLNEVGLGSVFIVYVVV